jgi:3-isopropylmalate/(R)-2-methylmalate dehydratase small subunit
MTSYKQKNSKMSGYSSKFDGATVDKTLNDVACHATTEKAANYWHAFLLGDDIDTDIIIPTEYLALKTVEDMKPYAFSPLRPELAGQIKPGDIIVAGKNFGCGSSREQAPEVIKALGIKCVIAKSYARIFFRNSINNGLLLIENADLHDAVKEGDTIDVEVNAKITHNGKAYPIASLPDNLVDILNAGGLVKAMRKLNGLD